MDLLDKIYPQKHECSHSVIKREICKKDIIIINNQIKSSVVSGNAKRTKFLLESLEQAILALESTYVLKSNSRT